MLLYRNKTTGETATMTPEQAERFFDNRDMRDWDLMEDEGVADTTEVQRFTVLETLVRREDYDALAAKLAESEAERDALRTCLKRWQETGCPDCHGDCASANPSVASCIMQQTSAALK